MRLSELTRQTRWGHPPPELSGTPPGAGSVHLLVWAPCNRCDLQTHGLADRAASEGLTCPECGHEILAERHAPPAA